MLVLTRKPSQRIRIGDDVVVSVIRVQGDKVRIGIEAPADRAVYREEVYQALHIGKDAGFRSYQNAMADAYAASWEETTAIFSHPAEPFDQSQLSQFNPEPTPTNGPVSEITEWLMTNNNGFNRSL